MKTLALIVLLAGCAADGGDDYPILVGGANPSPSPGATQPGVIMGRVCVLDDPRDLAVCSASGARGLTVTLAGSTTMAADDGSFSFVAPPAAADRVLGVTGPGIVPARRPVPSVLPAPPAPLSIPVLRDDLFSRMTEANGITLEPGSGSILGTVVRDGAPVPGITVTATPSPAFGPRFDGTTPISWTLDGTGARGVIWIPGVAAGPASLTFHDVGTSGQTTVAGVQVIDGGITIVDAVLP